MIAVAIAVAIADIAKSTLCSPLGAADVHVHLNVFLYIGYLYICCYTFCWLMADRAILCIAWQQRFPEAQVESRLVVRALLSPVLNVTR